MQNVSCQVCEMVHKAHMKEALACTNRRDWEIQVMTLHARENASIHLTERLIEEMEEDPLDSFTGWTRDFDWREQRELLQESNNGPSMGIRFPLEQGIWNFLDFERTLQGGGGARNCGEGVQIDIVELGDPENAFRASLDPLEFLGKNLANCIQRWYKEECGIVVSYV